MAEKTPMTVHETATIAQPEDFVPGARFEIVADLCPSGHSIFDGPVDENYKSDEDPLALYVSDDKDPFTTVDAVGMVVTYLGTDSRDGRPYDGRGPQSWTVTFPDGTSRYVSRGNVRPVKEA